MRRSRIWRRKSKGLEGVKLDSGEVVGIESFSQSLTDAIAYLFNDNLAAARAVFVLYLLTLATRVWNVTKKYQRDKLGIVPCYRSTLIEVVMLKAWRPGYLEMSKLEDKLLYRWSCYILLLLVAQQCEEVNLEVAKIVPVAAVAVICYWEIRSIFYSFEIGGHDWGQEARQYMDDIPRQYLPQLVRRILSIFAGQGYGNYPMQPPTNQQRPPPVTVSGQKPMLGQPPKDNNREGD